MNKTNAIQKTIIAIVIFIAALFMPNMQTYAADDVTVAGDSREEAYISKASITLAVKGQTSVTLYGDRPVSYKSSSKKVATVSKTGTITGKKAGKATITVTGESGCKYKCTVKVVKNQVINLSTMELKVGATGKLRVSGEKVVSYKSSAKKIAKISKYGTVTAKTEGKAVMTLTCESGKKYKCTVTVTKPAEKKSVIEEVPVTEEKTVVEESVAAEEKTVVEEQSIAENTVVSNNPEPIVTPDPEPIFTPDPEPIFTPDPEPIFTPDPEPIVTTAPEPIVTPDPEPIVTPDPEPIVTPDPEPIVTPAPEQITTPDYQALAKEMVQDIIKSKIIIPDSACNAEKVRRVHDWMVQNITYNMEAYDMYTSQGINDPVYITLEYHFSICHGYAKTFEVFMDELGIPCRYIDGMTTGGYHAWNIVQLEDGHWYNVDVTWDDPNPSAEFVNEYLRYEYLLRTDEQFSKDHTCEYEIAADGTVYSEYFCPTFVANFTRESFEWVMDEQGNITEIIGTIEDSYSKRVNNYDAFGHMLYSVETTPGYDMEVKWEYTYDGDKIFVVQTMGSCTCYYDDMTLTKMVTPEYTTEFFRDSNLVMTSEHTVHIDGTETTTYYENGKRAKTLGTFGDAGTIEEYYDSNGIWAVWSCRDDGHGNSVTIELLDGVIMRKVTVTTRENLVTTEVYEWLPEEHMSRTTSTSSNGYWIVYEDLYDENDDLYVTQIYDSNGYEEDFYYVNIDI